MSRLVLGTICGLVYGALSAASMIPLQFADKRAAPAGAFFSLSDIIFGFSVLLKPKLLFWRIVR